MEKRNPTAKPRKRGNVVPAREALPWRCDFDLHLQAPSREGRGETCTLTERTFAGVSTMAKDG
jgi:hypothetical protein